MEKKKVREGEKELKRERKKDPNNLIRKWANTMKAYR